MINAKYVQVSQIILENIVGIVFGESHAHCILKTAFRKRVATLQALQQPTQLAIPSSGS
jgi:hypothetical protein